MSRIPLWYVTRRLAALVLVLVFVSFAVFSLVHLAPGDAIAEAAGGATLARTPEMKRALEREFNYDRPFLVQYWLWGKKAVRGDLGDSLVTRTPVTDSVKVRAPTTLFLGAYALVLTLVIGVSLGTVAALRRGGAADRGAVAGSVLGLSTPAFVSGVLLLWLFAVKLRWFPAAGKGTGFWDSLWHLTLPAIALAITISALLVKHTRASMLNVVDQDYVTFARARGLSRLRILFAYQLRNALIPIVTIVGLLVTHVVAGAVLVETTFSIAGFGGLLVQSANARDLTMIQAMAVLVAIVVLLSNLVADLFYMAVDPRIRLGGESA